MSPHSDSDAGYARYIFPYFYFFLCWVLSFCLVIDGLIVLLSLKFPHCSLSLVISVLKAECGVPCYIPIAYLDRIGDATIKKNLRNVSMSS